LQEGDKDLSTIQYLTRIEFGEGEVMKLPALLQELGIKRPLIVTDKGLVQIGLVAPIVALFQHQPVLFDETPANPTEEAALAAHILYQNHGCDGIVGLGGGSSIDLAKAVRLLSGHPPPLVQYAAIEDGVSKIQSHICPLIAIPTTAGTGAEVGRAAVITMRDGRKLGILSPFLIPSIALCDPELTYALPPLLSAATGMDALSHCMETFMSNKFNPPADAIALDGLRRGWQAIERVLKPQLDKQARQAMMICALEGAMAFQKGLGAVHALTHPLGALKELNLHHGTLNALLMPAVLRFNRPAIGEKWQILAEIMGGEPDKMVAALNARLALPAGLSALGVTQAHMKKIARDALFDHCHLTNPRIPTEQQYWQILHESM